jgi:protein phosphatase slingshot
MFSFMGVPDLSDVISSVIPGILYISGMKPANNHEIIKDYMIRRIIRLGDLEDFQNIYKVHKDVEYLDFVIEDSVKSHISDEMFKQCIDFINEAGGPVLVHCYAGISRSSSIVIAYLMVKHNISMRNARLDLKKKRESISPNSTFIKDLLRFQVSIPLIFPRKS